MFVVAAEITVIIGPLLAAILAPLAAYYFARHSRTREMKFTEASQLWEESRSIRKELRDDVEELQGQVKNLLELNESLRVRVVQLEHELTALQAANERLKDENSRLRILIEGGDKLGGAPP